MKRLKINIGLHLMIAVVLSLVINFSYLLMPIITEQGINQRGDDDRRNGEHSTGTLYLSSDLHGYIVCDCEQRDSVYVSAWQVHSLKLQEGDHLHFSTREPKGDTYTEWQKQAAHPRLGDIYERNGEEFDFDAIYDRPSRTVEFVWQIVYYALVSFLMIMILTWMPRSGSYTNMVFVRRTLIVVALSAVGIYFAPVVDFYNGFIRIVFFFQAEPHNNVYLIVLTKCLFMLAVTILYARIYLLMRQQQTMAVENERLKTENLETHYNMLVGQINPHFFFNSLNSLAMLVREHDDKRALEYIDQLSYTFRYIIQNGQSSTTTLKEELAFAEAYAYLFKIRYADKLFFSFDIDPQYHEWTLPALSLQPLIGNAVKHNSITMKNPLRVTIRTIDGMLEIENPKHPKLDIEPSTGIGLENLKSRWQILTGHSIEIVDEAERFVVRMPLDNPEKK
ncbi:MAG: histidine kinase [Alistipes sp.]|nr:histidine kinase [Alistipes sp.]